MLKKITVKLCMLAAILFPLSILSFAQQTAVKKVEVTPASVEAEVGQKIQFTAVGKDADGKVVEQKVQAWFAGPFDIGGSDNNGTVTVYNPGIVQVGAVVGGQIGYATIRVKPAAVTKIEIQTPAPLVAGSATKLNTTARTLSGDPRGEVTFSWSSNNPSVAVVDAAGVVTALKAGKATLQAGIGNATSTINIEVIPNPVRKLTVEPKTITARTGDVVHFTAKAADATGGMVKSPAIRWSVSGSGATIEEDGGFVAENPGTYILTAICGDHLDTASVVVTPRNAERELTVIGRCPVKDFMAAEQWIIGDYAYLSTITNKLLVFNISDPKNPKLTDTVQFDAHLLNDVSTTPDGKIAVVSREGASNRKNGIVFLDTSDPAHPKKISEYTETVTGGVHSAFINDHYVYLTDDATGSLRVIDFKDVQHPKEVARWQVESTVAPPVSLDSPFGTELAGRYLHDVQVIDGLAYLAYWRDGLVILDVGKGIKGGSPENPKFVSQYRFNHNELYGDGWLAGTHAVFRYKNYVFVGDEVFETNFNLFGKERFVARGIAHVIDVSDIMNPREVAIYAVPEGGSHNIWVKDDLMYMGYYTGGARVVDVSGELRGDLYRQGREIARLWTGALEGYRVNQAFTWGAQPYKDMVFFNDVNTGIWITKLGKPKYKGSTTIPAQ